MNTEAKQLRDMTIDHDGSHMDDIEQPRIDASCGMLRRAADLIEQQAKRIAELEKPPQALPLSEWSESIGPAVWFAWSFDDDDWFGEPAWIGSPIDSDWPGYHTHFIPHPPRPEIAAEFAWSEPSDG